MATTRADYRDKFAAIVGKENIAASAADLARYEGAGFVSGVKPDYIVRVTHADQVRDVVRLARQLKVNLVASSSGAPHYRGDSVPSREGIVVDFSKMDAIVRINRRDRVGLIEPGVRFAALAEAADQAGLKALMPLRPRATKSVLASYLEREPIIIPKFHWDMTDPLLCTELVFGTGKYFRTGSAAGPGSLEEMWESGNMQINPMGPAATDFVRVVQGSQGTMALVTWATVKLELKPKIHRMYFIPGQLQPLIDLSYRLLRPKLADEYFILNSYALATLLADDPGEIAELAKKQAPFTVIYGVSGYEILPEERVKQQEEDIATITQAVGLQIKRVIPGCAGGRQMEAILSRPSPEPYYKTVPKGGFFDIFFVCTMDEVCRYTQLMQDVAQKSGYDPAQLGIYVQPVMHGRACHLEFTVYYNAADKKESAKARKLYSEASKALSEAGAFYSRPYGEWSDLAYAKCPDTVEVLKRVKGMLDPDGILNPGKICFKEEA